jgi:hypothetical protein
VNLGCGVDEIWHAAGVITKSHSIWLLCSVYTVECALGYNKFDFFLETEEQRPFDGRKIEI